MALIVWSDKLSVGIRSIDAQHGILVDTVNELHDAMLKGQAKSVTEPLLRNLVACTRDLFSTEEALMDQANYPELAQHRAKHRDLTKKVESYIERFARGDITLSVHLLNFLRDWLTNHFQREDRAYSLCMNASGIQ